jgi:abortive infection bacteriophage resistance protein
MSHLDKPFTIDEQILSMRKYITFTQKKKIKKLLEYSGYFRLSRYGKYLLSHTSTLKIKPNQDLLFDVYNFDKDLRRVFFHYCKKAEIQFKSHISNSISIIENNPEFYLNRNYYTDTKSERDKIRKSSNIKFFNTKFYKNIVENENELRSKKNKYPELKEYRFGGKRARKKIPSWAAFSYFDFGTITNMYSYLRGDLRKVVLKYGYSRNKYGKDTTKMMDTWLDAVRNLRNACAHHSRIIGRLSSIVLLDIEDDNNILKSETDLFSRIYALKKILRPEDSEQMKNEIVKTIRNTKLNIYQFNILPRNWEVLFDNISYL